MMKKRAKQKRWRAGETLVELLTAVLILSFSALLLATMYLTAVAVNKKADDWEKELYDAVTEAEEQSGTPQKGSVRFEIEDEPDGTGEIEVNVYGNGAASAYTGSEADGGTGS